MAHARAFGTFFCLLAVAGCTSMWGQADAAAICALSNELRAGISNVELALRSVEADDPEQATVAATAAAQNGHLGSELLAGLTDSALNELDAVRLEQNLNNVVQVSNYLGALGYAPGRASEDLASARRVAESLTSFEGELPALLAKYNVECSAGAH